ncbi:MAG: PQQ-binding-like beta-propeller repeat protein [Gemmataceae bacterium]
MSRTRRLLLVLTTLAAAALPGWLGFTHQQAQGQKLPNPPGDESSPAQQRNTADEFTDAISLPPNPHVQKMLDAAHDYIARERWNVAVEVLQGLLDIKEDAFVKVTRLGPDGRTTVRWTSVRAEASRLIGALPANGLETYEVTVGNRARTMLDEALKEGNIPQLALVAQRYLHTKAGTEATELLGTYYLDRGRSLEAALCFERLLQNNDSPSPRLLLKATLAFRASGGADPAATKALADRTWKRFTVAHPNGISLNGRAVALTDLREEFDRRRDLNRNERATQWWAMFQGAPARTALAEGDTPYLDEFRWRQLTIPPRRTGINHVKNWINEAVELAPQQGVMQSFFPVAARNRLIYRTHAGIDAIDIASGRLQWSTGRLGRCNLDALSHSNAEPTLRQWLQAFQASLGNVLLENSTLGTLSTDGNLVFAIEDIPVPPPPHLQLARIKSNVKIAEPMQDALAFNKLQAIALDGGRLVWEVGGEGEAAGELADAFFLGAPLPLEGKLYVLIEQEGLLRLVCLEAATGKVSWTQKLAAVRDPLPRDPLRRMNAVHLAFGDGILVCPTNAGAILGVDLLTHSLHWAHSYGEEDANPDPYRRQRVPSLRTDWKFCAPIVRDGKVIFTAPDGKSLHCLNLRDGTLLWKADRTDDVYLAGAFRGKALVVGKHGARALDLVDGRQLWTTETGQPSGFGAASGNLYYLPLKAAAHTGAPEVCVLDIDSGRVVAHTRGHSPDAPGNLVFHEGKVVSQTATEVVAYPQVRMKLAELDALVMKEPDNPARRFERGELRLFRGDLPGAVDDLQATLSATDLDADLRARSRSKLFDALTQHLQADFDKGQRYLKQYENLCTVNVPTSASLDEREAAQREQRQRQSTYLSLLARGREKQGRLLESFQAYLDFGQIAGSLELIALLDEPTVKVRPDVWVQGRIGHLLQKADLEQRTRLEKEIERRWQKAASTNSTDELRRFVALFGNDEGVAGNLARESRLQLAERLIDEGTFIEAELQLLHVHRQKADSHAGRAALLLARLMTRRGLFEDAAYWYRVLRDDFAATVVIDGKTGADLYRALTTDKRFLPYLDVAEDEWEKGRVEAEKTEGNFGATVPRRQWLEMAGRKLPYFRRCALALNWNTTALELYDRQSRRNLLSHPLNNNRVTQAGNRARHEVPCHLLGHLAVVEVGTMIYGVDTVEQQVLWQRDLLTEGMLPPNQYYPDGESGLRVVHIDGRMQRLGLVAPVLASGIRLQTQAGLVLLDPFTGTPKWARHDLPAMARVFGDDNHLYFIDQRADGSVGQSHGVRARDGVSIEVPDFGPLLARKARVLGQQLLAIEQRRDQTVAKLYDARTNIVVWSQNFAADAKVLNSDVPHYLGVIEPSRNAKLTIIDLHTRRVVLERAGEYGLRATDLDNANDIHLLADRQRFYVAINLPPDPNLGGGPWSNLQGMNALSLNGALYGFARHNEKSFWRSAADIKNTMIVIDHFEDLPVILCTARYYEWDQGGRRRTTVVSTRAFEKRTGKLKLDDRSNTVSQFYTLNVDPLTPHVELVGNNARVDLTCKLR